MHKVVELLPDMLTKAPRARLSIDFNLALLNGGDKMFAAQQDVLALLFYNLVLPPARFSRPIKNTKPTRVVERTSAQVGTATRVRRGYQSPDSGPARTSAPNWRQSRTFPKISSCASPRPTFGRTGSTRRSGPTGRFTRTIRMESWPKTPATAHSRSPPSLSRTQRRRKRGSSTWRPFPKASSGRM